MSGCRARRCAGPLTTRAVALALFACAGTVRAQPPAIDPLPSPDRAPSDEDKSADELARERDPVDISIFAGQTGRRITGSAHKINNEELERFEDDNIHRTLTRVGGVYVRGEDGYGLRPNIGLRGASSDRSKKITLLEDGVLFAPAPYSAPAAYYFPLSTRMTGIEVFKGPSALRYGPNSIGGAINLLTRPIPFGHRFGADLALGSELYLKQHGYYGYGARHAGFLVEVARLRSNGFKQQQGAPPLPLSHTGFDKTEVMAKARVNTNPDARYYHEGRFKLGYARESSNETYLGLSEADFRATPLRRYAASALDRMHYDRTQLEASYGFVWRDLVQLSATWYRQELSRAWRKLNRFAGAELLDILREPTSGQRAVYHAILSGAQDSVSSDHTLLIGTNDRRFLSQGIQLTGNLTLPKLGPVSQRLQIGARLHHDTVERLHQEGGYRMVAGDGGRLVPDGLPVSATEHNHAEARAFAGYLIDEISAFGVLVAPGIRTEIIRTELIDRLSGIVTEGSQRVLLPGVGVLYQVVEPVAVLGGVHQGFSPVAPGQPEGIKPEVAVNYELGTRLHHRFANVEAIGFFSDYSNLTGECTFSSGCSEQQIDQQFNAGRVHIYGVEATAALDIPTRVGIGVPVRVSYTFTTTRFLTSFSSDNPSWGEVEEGDELPYVPPHQLAVTLGLDWKPSTRRVLQSGAGMHLGVTFVDEMREVAGSGEPDPFDRTDAFATFDASLYWQLLPELRLYAKGENLLDSSYVVSHRPYGARPGHSRFGYAGLKIDLD